MKNLLKRTLTVTLSALLVASSAAVPAIAKTTKKAEKNYEEGEVIAVLKDNAPAKFQSSAKASAAYGEGVKLTGSYTFSANKGNKLRVASLKSGSLSTKKLIKKLKQNSAVKYAFPNYKKKAASVTKDKYSDYLWALENKGQNNGAAGNDVKAASQWEKAEKADNESVVAIIDTGIDLEHEDLEDIIWENPYGSKLLGKHGYDSTGTNDDYEPRDDNGHGSHCAGIVAGKGDNGVGISGINKSGVKVMALKFLDASGSGYTDDALACFDYISRAAKLGTNISAISCSWGGDGDEDEKLLYDELFDEFGKQGIITCVAAGNESTDIDEDMEDGWYSTPACSSSRYCITVGASNGKDELASFSNTGAESVDIAAPGTEILSTVSYNCFNPTIYTDKELEKLCSYIQKYNGSLSKTDFGYPNKMDIATSDEDEESAVDFTSKLSKDFFGTGGKSVAITPEEGGTVWFEMPYTFDDWYDNYSVSFMVKGESSFYGSVYDVPADYTIDDILGGEDDDDDFIIYLSKGVKIKSSEDFAGDAGYWDHVTLDVAPYDDDYDDEDYDYEDDKVKKAKAYDDDDYDNAYDDIDENNERKLVFCVETDDTFYLDDVAVSHPKADSDDFGKYDFYNGTSMATPYVAGAVALVRKNNPEANAADILNMVRNTGREAEELLVSTSSVLSLDRTEELPPLITSFDLNDDGKLQLDGSFRDINFVRVNGKRVEPEKTTNTSIILPDSDYNTTYVDVLVRNAFGSDTLEKLVSNKKAYTLATNTVGTAIDTSNGIMVNAGDEAYYIDAENDIGVISYDYEDEHYTYSDKTYHIDFEQIDRLKNTQRAYGSAVYLDGKIYIAAQFNVLSSNGVSIIGYESALCAYDIKDGTLTDYGELNGENIAGASVAAYKGEIYVIGGHDYVSGKITDSVYKLTNGKLEKTDYKLPEGRAYGKFIEYGGKLIGAYGVQEDEEMPQIILFDGTKWTDSKLFLSSDDYDTLIGGDSVEYRNYAGNLGYDKDGVFFNGVYCYTLGDTFTYNPETDRAEASSYSFNNVLGGPRLVGTTVPGAFIGFNVVVPVEEEDDDWFFWSMSASKNSVVANGADEDEINTYTLALDNGEPKPQPVEPASEEPATAPATTPSTPKNIAQPKLSASSVSLKAGAAKQLKVSGGAVRSWTTSNKKVATVADGKITALKKGSATITATLTSGKKLTAKIKVTTNPKLKKKSVKVKAGKTVKVKITGKAKNVKLSFKNTKLAKVVSKKTAKTLKVRGLKKGSTTLTITVNGKKLKLKVKVR